MKKLLILLIALCLLLTGCGVVPPDATEDGTGGTEDRVSSGWVTEAAQTFYIREDGSRHSGWLELDGNKYYLDEHGVLQTGWLELSGKTYYLKENGAVARGKTVIDNKTHYFIASGEEIILANPWNIIPSTYEPELKDVDPNDGEYMPVDVSCWDALVKMLADCRKAHEDLDKDLQKMLDRYKDEGKEPNPIAKGMSWMKTNMKLAMNESDKTIAELITDGCNMGVKSLSRYLNEYAAADEASKDICKRLISLEEKLAVQMRDFL